MNTRITLITLVSAAIAAAGLGLSLSGLAVTGPDQSFTIPAGGSESSYLTVWNEGDGTATIDVSAHGDVSGLVDLGPGSVQLGPGASTTITVTYSVSSGQPAGLCEGWLEASTGEGMIATSVSRPVRLWVTSGDGSEVTLELNGGLNLISWPSATATFEEAFGSNSGVERVWRRTSSGDYVSASYYPGSGWWSADSGFTCLETACGYFVECSGPIQVQVSDSVQPADLELESGTNLVGWVWDPMPVEVAILQSPSYHPVSKIWRRNPDGSYTSIQFFPDQGIWWSSDSDFTGLETGRAYFFESTEAVLSIG